MAIAAKEPYMVSGLIHLRSTMGPNLKFETHVMMNSYNVYGLDEFLRTLGKVPGKRSHSFRDADGHTRG